MLITAPDGGILNDPVMLRLDENTFWFALADSDVLPYAKGLAAHAGMDVQLSEAEADPLQIQGPKSKDVVRDLFGDEILDLRYYHFRRLELDGIPVILTRTGWTSEVGYEIYLLDASRGTDLWERIMEAGAAVRDPPDRAGGHPPDRGRHLQLGRRHDLREQPVRAGPRTGSSIWTATPTSSPGRRSRGSATKA